MAEAEAAAAAAAHGLAEITGLDVDRNQDTTWPAAVESGLSC